jgi:hypothetical protein
MNKLPPSFCLLGSTAITCMTAFAATQSEQSNLALDAFRRVLSVNYSSYAP